MKNNFIIGATDAKENIDFFISRFESDSRGNVKKYCYIFSKNSQVKFKRKRIIEGEKADKAFSLRKDMVNDFREFLNSTNFEL